MTNDIYAPFWFFQIMDKKVMGWGGYKVTPKGCSQPELMVILSMLQVLMVLLMILTQLLLSCVLLILQVEDECGDIPMVLVQNKIDLISQSQIDQ